MPKFIPFVSFTAASLSISIYAQHVIQVTRSYKLTPGLHRHQYQNGPSCTSWLICRASTHKKTSHFEHADLYTTLGALPLYASRGLLHCARSLSPSSFPIASQFGAFHCVLHMNRPFAQSLYSNRAYGHSGYVII